MRPAFVQRKVGTNLDRETYERLMRTIAEMRSTPASVVRLAIQDWLDRRSASIVRAEGRGDG